jgi:alpha-glucuronidase
LVRDYEVGADEARHLEARWRTLQGKVDEERYEAVLTKLRGQAEDAAAWSDKCLRYFQAFSNRPLSSGPSSSKSPKRII